MNLSHLLSVAITLIASPLAIAEPPQLSFAESDTSISILVENQVIGCYYYQDKRIPRPFFANVKAPGGIQVTRNHPPKPGDRDDHATMHPGIWLAFGDLSGADVWRNQASVQHVDFLQRPTAQGNRGAFIERKRYARSNGEVICDETFQCSIEIQPQAYLLSFKFIFSSDHQFSFGDQEEMGLGLRVATTLSEVGGGHLIDSDGRIGAKAIWGNSSAWCDSRGRIDNQSVGVTVMSHPMNFRPAWWHARDYGLVTANPFGRSAMKQGTTSQIVVNPGETLILRFAVYVHCGAESETIRKAYDEFAESSR